LKTKQVRPQRRLLGGESAVEGDRISPLESHRQPLEQVRCFPGVFLGHLVRMDESTDARRILTAVPQSEWRRPVGRPYTREYIGGVAAENDSHAHLV